MAVYTDISDRALDDLVARYDLGRAVSIKGIAEGIENSNFYLETEGGRFVLTLYERRVRAEELPFFIALMQWTARHGFPCPEPVADRDGRALQTVEGRPAALCTFLTGVSVRTPGIGHCREAGAAIGRLHAATEGFDGRRANTLGQSAWAGLFEGRESQADTLEPGLSGHIRGDLAVLAARWPTGLPSGVIHADFFPDNVLFMRGRFSAAIDFYFACHDALAYDLAVALNAWAFDAEGRFMAGHARAMIEGYDSVRPLSEAERDGLPILAYGAAMRFFLTRLIDWTRDDTAALVRPKNPSDYVRRLAFHREALARGEDPFRPGA